MTEPARIIRLFFARMKPAFFQLPVDERARFMADDRRNLDELGMQAIAMIDCTGTEGEWDYIGVESWPSREAITWREKFETDVLDLSRYVEYTTIEGKEQSFEDYGKSPE